MSNNNIEVFSYQDSTVRTLTDEHGEVWFVAKDVCDVLEISDYHQAVETLDDDERGRYSIPTPGGMQSMTTINEPGLYKLIFKSRKPSAKEFTRWVTHEVLPQLHKTGSYSLPSVARAIQVDKKDKLPAHSGGIKAGERLAAKVFKCKKPEDFQAVIAMDEDFRDAFGYSWLERHGFRLVKKLVPTTWEERADTGLWMWDKKEAFAWEHDYDLDKITERNSTNDYDIYPF